jgi:hypothetical protein
MAVWPPNERSVLVQTPWHLVPEVTQPAMMFVAVGLGDGPKHGIQAFHPCELESARSLVKVVAAIHVVFLWSAVDAIESRC